MIFYSASTVLGH